MFDSVNITPNYLSTFTETQRALSGNISQALSSYLGNIGVAKLNQNKLIQSDNSSDSTDSTDLTDQTDNTAQSATVKNTNTQSGSITDDNNSNDNFNEQITNDDDDNYDDTDLIISSNFSAIKTSFASLAAAAGATGDKVSKEQLFTLLQSLTSDVADSEENTEEIAFVKNLIAKFDTLSDGSDYITSFNNLYEPQDYETITQEQVTPPIDLRI